MPETMEFPTMDPKQLDWVQNYYKLRGWAFPDAGPAASVETPSETDVQAEQPVREIVDQVQAEFTVQLIASELEHAESTHEELAELQEELRAQDSNAQATAQNKSQVDLIQSQVKLIKKQREAEGKLIPTSGLDDRTQGILAEMLALCDRKLEIAEAQAKLGGFDEAQSTLTDVQHDLSDIRTARLAAQVSQPAPEPSAALKVLTSKTQEAARSLRQIEFVGLAKSLEAKLKDLSQEVAPEEHAYWGMLEDEVQKTGKAIGVLTKTSDRIGVIRNSLDKEGFDQWAHNIETELASIQAREGRTVLGTVSDLNLLKSSAERYEEQAKGKEWDDAELGKVTAEVREQFDKLIKRDDLGRIETKDDKTHVERKAGTYKDLDHDVYVQIPRRGNKKVPRETVQAVLDSLEFLDELHASGVKGVDSIAKQELEKAKGILDGIANNAGDYAKLKKKLADLSDKIDKLASGRTAGFYIEERLRLAEKVSKLSAGYTTMPIETAKTEFSQLLRTDFEELHTNAKEAEKTGKDFETKSAAVIKDLDRVAALVNDDLVSKIRAVLPHDKIPFFERLAKSKGAGPLKIEHEDLLELAKNALTKEDMSDALSKMGDLKKKTARQAEILYDLAKLKQTSDLNHHDQQKLDQITSDYLKDQEDRRNNKDRAKEFAAMAKPLKDELDAMLRDKVSLKRILDKFKGHSRVDPETFDLSRLRDLRDELTVLEKRSITKDEFAKNKERFNDLQQSMDFIRSEITGFRDDLAQGLTTYAERCIGTLQDAADFVRNDFVTQVDALKGDGQNVVDQAALQRFANNISSQLVLQGLKTHTDIIADRDQDLAARKQAREQALRQVRPLLAQIRGNAGIQHYLNHPFTSVQNKLHIAVDELTQLEVRLLQLAS